MLNLKSSFKFKSLVAGLVVASALTLSQGSVYAVNSTVLDITATVNSSLAIAVTNTGAQSFDPSVANAGVKVGAVTITANVTNGVKLSIYQSNAGAANYTKTTAMTLSNLGGDSNAYSLKLIATNSGPNLSATTFVNYADSVSLAGAQNFANKAYDIQLSTTAAGAVLPNGQYKDSLVFSLVAL